MVSVSDCIINEGLKDCRGIGESERHNKLFVMPCGHVKSSLPLIYLSDAHKVVGIAQVKLDEDRSFLENFKRQ